MKWARHPRTRFLLAFIGIISIVASLVVRLGRVGRTNQFAARLNASPQLATSPAVVTQQSPSPTAQPKESESAAVRPDLNPSPVAAPTLLPGLEPALIIPVAGVRSNQLRDTFDEARSEGRVHDAIDIPAARGTPVLAAADGTIAKLFQSERGGTTIYELSSDKRFFYYYAHLERYLDGLSEGMSVKQGSTIAYVGDTGNAGPGNYHLHFSISIASDPRRWWEGTNINPYPILKR